MIRRFCDGCGAEMNPPTRDEAEQVLTTFGRVSRIGDPQTGVDVDVQVRAQILRSDRPADVCRACVFEALDPLDPRPVSGYLRPGESAGTDEVLGSDVIKVGGGCSPDRHYLGVVQGPVSGMTP